MYIHIGHQPPVILIGSPKAVQPAVEEKEIVNSRPTQICEEKSWGKDQQFIIYCILDCRKCAKNTWKLSDHAY